MRGILVLAILAIACRLEAESMKIVENGKSDYVIATSKNASPAEILAANELSKYIEQMSGAILPLSDDIAPRKAIIIAPDPAIIGEGYRIRADGATIYIEGGRGRSTLYAVYDLLDRLGCRWLAPNFNHYQGVAEFVPKSRDLAIDLSQPIVEKPALSIRKLYVEEGHSHNAENLAQMVEWMPKARFNMLVIPTNYSGRGVVKWDNWREALTPELQKRDLVIEVGGHGYQNFLNAKMEDGKLFEGHPDWFGMGADGKRQEGQNRVFCLSNDKAVEYLVNNFLEYLKGRPEIQTYAFWPPDGASWCECPKCKAIGAPADQQAYLLAKVKAQVAKVRPDVRLEIIAYAKAIAPPVTQRMDKSVLVDFCPIQQCFEVQINDQSSEINAMYVKELTAWRKQFDGDISIYSYYRKYAWKSLPNLIPHYMQKDLQFYGTIPTQGISSYAEPGDWFTYELNHYVLGNLGWNPSVNVDALIEKFAEARFGSSAEAAMSTYAVLEDVVRHACGIPGTSLKTVDELTKAQEKLDLSAENLRTAESRATDPGIARNIERMLLMIEYARLDIDVQKSKAAKEPKEKTDELVDKVALFLKQHGDDGVFVLHTRTESPRLQKTYSVQ
ncbi:MAG TPA: DUF4838 domain-containing protein [Armatimonadota bacterium]|nr:DUF4838 domain-containing protein [Armatimonadota bacterium]